MNKAKLSPPENKFFYVTCTNLFSGEKKDVCMSMKLPGKRTIRMKIKMCIDILFDRTYER